MVGKLTNKKIIQIFKNVRDEEVRTVLLHDGIGLCSLKFIYDHEKEFRKIMPTYLDKYLEHYHSRHDATAYYISTSYADRESFMAYMCLETGVVDVKDFRTVVNFATAGIDIRTLSYCAPSSAELFLEGILNLSAGVKTLLDFVEERPEYLNYFLPLMCSKDNIDFYNALMGYIKSAGLQDSLRVHIFETMLCSHDSSFLLRFIDEIDNNNYYRFKALNDAAVLMGDYTVILPSKELVAVLKDAALKKYEKYYTSDFKHTYHFYHAYERMFKRELKELVSNLLEKGNERSRWALLNSVSIHDFADEIFSHKLTLEDLSFFLHRMDCDSIQKSILPKIFESLFSLLTSMDKVNYHFKTDEDITFARDISKADIISKLAHIATILNQLEYIQRLDEIYDSLKEDAQAKYLSIIGSKTKLDIRSCAIRFLKTDNYYAIHFFDEQKIKLEYKEAVLVSDYLKSKKESIKTKIIKTFLNSKDCNKIIEYLLSCKEEYKLSAGMEMQKSTGKIDTKKIEKKTEMFRWRTESVFTIDYPEDEINQIIKQKIKVPLIKPISKKQLKEFFSTIKDFIQEHKDYEYAINFSEGLVSFGSYFAELKGNFGSNEFESFPLGKEIKELIKGNFSQEIIAGILVLLHCVECRNKSMYITLCGNKLFGATEENYEYAKELDKGYLEFTILRRLQYAIAKDLLSKENKLSLLATIAQMDPFEKPTEKAYSAVRAYPEMYCKLLLAESDDIETLKALVVIECIFIKANVNQAFSLELNAEAYEKGLISERLSQYFLLKHEYLSGLFMPSLPQYILRSDYKNQKFKALVFDFVNKALNAEFSRGSLQTPYTLLLNQMRRIYGMENYFKAIVALRGLTWVRSPYGCEKNESFSNILKSIVKDKCDTYEAFEAFVEKYKLTKDELMQATLFNPEFVDFTARYLNIPHLKLAVFWFIAHLNEALYGEKQERRIEQIKEFSDISYPDFKDGAFDSIWYKEMIEKVPEDILKKIYADAKYVTVGGLHKRAQRFFDAMNGRIEKEECLEKIYTTRNKDYCLIYSLIPIKNRADLHERYTILSEFVRQSKQFGSQRQLSERRTVDIAFENLARVAGYANANIFLFEMESETPVDIYKPYTIEDVIMTPYIDENKFKISYRIQKDGKNLSSLPSKYGKSKEVVCLRDEIKQLNQKLRRIILSFENAMNLHTPFTMDQLKNMCRERLFQVVLNKVVLIADGILSIYDDGLKSMDGKSIVAESIYIAHPVELKQKGFLSEAISYIAKHNIKQPFKQVLREIYTKSDIELAQDEVLRFKGFEVDLKKCIAALKGKGWGVSEDIGLRKVYYHTDIVAAIFRECDFLYTADYTNVNRELHGIFFLKRKSGEIIPIKDVDEITYSETLRDVDLMISISSKVVYDFELAMSTIEVRHEVLKSIIAILGLNNVSFLKDNIKVEGKLGSYLINIRTGLVFKEGKGNLFLDTVYSVDKPILLDFVDEDPMTADIISKAVVLANDSTIKDSAILREIKD